MSDEENMKIRHPQNVDFTVDGDKVIVDIYHEGEVFHREVELNNGDIQEDQIDEIRLYHGLDIENVIEVIEDHLDDIKEKGEIPDEVADEIEDTPIDFVEVNDEEDDSDDE